ncbi:MAG: hypothetical protein WC511_05335 [Candidatus Pacearchaeota archaeon]
MNEYINPNQEDYAIEHKRNILETAWGRMGTGVLEARFESLMDERIEEKFSDE